MTPDPFLVRGLGLGTRLPSTCMQVVGGREGINHDTIKLWNAPIPRCQMLYILVGMSYTLLLILCIVSTCSYTLLLILCIVSTCSYTLLLMFCIVSTCSYRSPEDILAPAECFIAVVTATSSLLCEQRDKVTGEREAELPQCHTRGRNYHEISKC